MNKKYVKNLIIIMLLLFLTTTNAFAFSDVSESDWYHTDVRRLQRQSIINGYDDGTFRPNNVVSNGEALKIILESADIEPLKQINEHWASGYLESALNNRITSNGNLDLDKPITRFSVSEMIVKAYELNNLKPEISYFYDTMANGANVLYEMEILKGISKDDKVYFYPNNNITRAELGAIIIRLKDYNAKKLIHEPITNEEISYPKQPKTKEELEKLLLYMGYNNKYEMTVNYSTGISYFRSEDFEKTVSDAFEYVFNKYPEYFSATNGLSYRLSGNDSFTNIKYIIKNPDFEYAEGEIIKMYSYFKDEAKYIILDLIATGKITENMSDKDKARVIYDWIIDYSEYDYNYEENLQSFSGYGLLKNKKAVCLGYTATYNYMAKLLCLDVQGIAGTSIDQYGNPLDLHIWTLITVDGNTFHIDTTWGDIIGEPNKYFFATSEAMKRDHSWK